MISMISDWMKLGKSIGVILLRKVMIIIIFISLSGRYKLKRSRN